MNRYILAAAAALAISGFQTTLAEELDDSGDDPSSVDEIDTDALRGKIFNLQGIPVEGELTPGVYIIDGKKVYVR